MGLHISFRVQPVTTNRKYGTLPRAPTVRTVGLSGIANGAATREAVTFLGQKHPGYAVIIGTSGHRPK